MEEWKPPPENQKASLVLRDALSGHNAENVANHIYRMYSPMEMELLKSPRNKLLGVIKPKISKEPINPYAFFTITDLLCIKAENPIADACEYVDVAAKQAENAYDKGKFLQARQWESQKKKCEDRVNNLLNITSEIPPSEFGKIGYTWSKNLIWDLPDTALKIDSPSIAGNEMSVDLLFNRWKTKYTNRCWGLSCCCPSLKLKNFTRPFNTPASAFWSNLFAYLIFLFLATWLATSVDSGLFQFHTSLVNTFVDIDDIKFGDLEDAASYWTWANKAFTEQLFSQGNQTYLVGNLIFRQFRVKASPCSSDPSRECFDDLDLQSNVIKDGEWQGTYWDTHSSFPNTGSIYGFLPSGGFKVELEGDVELIKATFKNLTDFNWIGLYLQVESLFK